MSEFICIKEIPHFCAVGERGTIVTETLKEYIDLVDEFHPRGWGFFRIVTRSVIKFNFNSTFYDNQMILGKPIYLNEHFKKIK